MNAFVACSGCRRHVRGSDSTCPFCGAAIDATAVAAIEARVTATTGARLARGALVAVGVGVALAVTACPKTGTASLYGGPPPHDQTATSASASDSATTAPTASTTVDVAPTENVPMYGGPPATLYGGPPRD